MESFVLSHCPYCHSRLARYEMTSVPEIQFWCANYGEHKFNAYYNDQWQLRNIDISEGSFNIKINFLSWSPLNLIGSQIFRRVKKGYSNNIWTEKKLIADLPNLIINIPLLTFSSILPYIGTYVIFS